MKFYGNLDFNGVGKPTNLAVPSANGHALRWDELSTGWAGKLLVAGKQNYGAPVIAWAFRLKNAASVWTIDHVLGSAIGDLAISTSSTTVTITDNSAAPQFIGGGEPIFITRERSGTDFEIFKVVASSYSTLQIVIGQATTGVLIDPTSRSDSTSYLVFGLTV